MSDLEILAELIADNARVPTTRRYNRNSVRLTEPECQDSYVDIVGLPDEVIVIKADSFPSPGTIFTGARGELKRADFIIIASKGTCPVIVYIELKRTGAPSSDIDCQLRGARSLLDYVQSIGRAFWRESSFLSNAQHRFVSFGHTAIRKRRTRLERPSGMHDQPERRLKIDWAQKVEFNQLAGGP